MLIFPTDISVDNTLRQRFIDSNTWAWSDGPINSLNVSVLDTSSAGLSACFYRGPIENLDEKALNGTIANTGMRLFVATSETSFAQYAWRTGLAQWTYETEWNDVNALASPACMGWGAGQMMHVAFVDLDNMVSVYW